MSFQSLTWQLLLMILVLLPSWLSACATPRPLTPAAQFRAAAKQLKSMTLEDIRQECEAPRLQDKTWYAEVEPLRERYIALACQRAAIMGQRDWLAQVPCDELKRRLWHDVPLLPDGPSARNLRKTLWKCEMAATYFDRFDLEHIPASRTVENTVAQALVGLDQGGFAVFDALKRYLAGSDDGFSKVVLVGGFYAGFRGLGRWLATQGPERCQVLARALLPVMDADSRRPAQGYRGVNGLIHGLLDGRCYRGMSLLGAREIRIRVAKAVADGRTGELTRCRWIAQFGSPDGREDIEAVMANPKHKAWIDRNSPSCLFALDKVRRPYSPPPPPN